MSSFLTGIVKAPVFAAIIALVGCFQGFQVGGSADSVGRQTTLSVVQAIFLVILADALFSAGLQLAQNMSAAMEQPQNASAVIDIRDLHTRYGKAVVHENVSLTVRPGEIFSLVGGSGCGKSTLLRAIIMLLKPVSGSIRVFGQEVIGLSDEQGA